jgi:4-amino-4-deoxy-L-arabinose transferase-like glycosyltransferase
LSLIRTRTFDTDELEHLHAAWSFHEGLLPYRDFSEHHMPGIYYLLSALMRRYDIVHQVNDTIAILFAARTLMWLFVGAIIVLTFLLGTRYGGRAVGWLSTAFLSLSVVFVGRSLEIRPDVPAAAFWVASQWALVNALAPLDEGRARRQWWVLGGLMLGAALTFTQKALLAGPGFVVLAALYVLPRDPVRSVLSRVIDLAVFVGTATIPLLLIAWHFWTHGAVRPLLDSVLINNLGWIQELTPLSTIRWMLLRDPFLCAFATAGFLTACVQLIRDRGRPVWRAAIFLPTASLFAGMWLIPTPFPQYLLPVLPAASIFAAAFLRTALAGSADGQRHLDRLDLTLATTALVVVAALGLWTAQPFFRHVAIYPIVGVMAVAAVLWLTRRGQIDAACAVAIVAVSTYSLQQLVWMAGLRNSDALAQMRFIHAATTPADSIMDGFTGVGWFRPHASFYWMSAPGPRARIPQEATDRMMAMLGGCGTEPRIVILDEYLNQLSPQVAPLVSNRYQPTAYPTVWLRNAPPESCHSESPEVNKSQIKSLPSR